MWQYSFEETIPGIETPTDVNLFSSEIRKRFNRGSQSEEKLFILRKDTQV